MTLKDFLRCFDLSIKNTPRILRSFRFANWIKEIHHDFFGCYKAHITLKKDIADIMLRKSCYQHKRALRA